MVRVLFVCLGNICRSPMAEAVFRHMVCEQGLTPTIVVDSAGTGDWHIGEPPHAGTLHELERHHISTTGLYARRVTAADFATADYLLAMDTANLDTLRRLAPAQQRPILARLLDYVPDAPQLDIPDPYYTGTFESVYDLVESGCGHFLDHLLVQSREHELEKE